MGLIGNDCYRKKHLVRVRNTGPIPDWAARLRVRPVQEDERARWRDLIARHHYLGFRGAWSVHGGGNRTHCALACALAVVGSRRAWRQCGARR